MSEEVATNLTVVRGKNNENPLKKYTNAVSEIVVVAKLITKISCIPTEEILFQNF